MPDDRDDLDDFRIKPTSSEPRVEMVPPDLPEEKRGSLFPATLAIIAVVAVGLLAVVYFVFRNPAAPKAAPRPVASVSPATDIYDPVSETSVPGAPMAEARSMHEAARLPNGEVLVIGGGHLDPPTTWVYLSSTEIYTPTDPPSCPATP